MGMVSLQQHPYLHVISIFVVCVCACECAILFFAPELCFSHNHQPLKTLLCQLISDVSTKESMATSPPRYITFGLIRS